MSTDLSHKKIISLLGGPGSGKGTASERIKAEYNVGYMCAGELLRKEAQQDTPFGRDLAEQLRLGKIVPQEVTIGLLRKEIESQEKDFYIIDGFPRAVEQAITFENTVQKFAGIIFLEASDDILVQRLSTRAKSSGRSDDNDESIKLRVEVFHKQSYPVIEHFQPTGKVHRVDASGTPEEVYNLVKEALNKIIA